MGRVDFMMGTHNHQPIGNFEHVFEESFTTCYEPQLNVLKEHPGIKLNLHHSGPLLDWLEANRPKYIDDVAALAQRGQVEILSGGYYEPILSSIPEGDAIGQIEMMNEYILKRFGLVPQGAWLTERIWDPSIPKILSKAGIRYTLLDDTHFYYAGLGADDMTGYYMTEKHGHSVAVFPIDKNLRYSIPFKMPGETIDYLRQADGHEGTMGITYGDDGEKLGLWPGTYQWVYEEKWLHNFYTALEENADAVNTALFSDHLDSNGSMGRVYMPMASYEEMMEWTLNTESGAKFSSVLKQVEEMGKKDDWKPFIRGGVWDNFLSKYEEANRMHKRMLHISGKVSKLEHDDIDMSAARRELYKGQCNCAYWHGMFGGLYLNSLRHAVYHSLINAEKIADKASKADPHWVDISQFDFNMNGAFEIVVENPQMTTAFNPGYGGSLFLLDYKPSSFSLTNTFMRRKETYHDKIIHHATEIAYGHGDDTQPESIHDMVTMKEEGLENNLIYDRYGRHCFQDHFFGDGITMAEFMSNRYDPPSDNPGASYDVISIDKKDDNAIITMSRDSELKLNGNSHLVTIAKEFTINNKDATITAIYEIANNGDNLVNCMSGIEFNLTLLAADAEDRYWVIPGSADRPRLKVADADVNMRKIGMRDDWAGFEVSLASPELFDAWRFPVETVSQSESGFEKTYQGSCIVLLRKLELGPGEKERFTITLSVEQTK